MKEGFHIELLGASPLGKRLGIEWRTIQAFGESGEIVRFENSNQYYNEPKWLYVWNDCLYSLLKDKGILDEEDVPYDEIRWHDYEYYLEYAREHFLPKLCYDHVFEAFEKETLDKIDTIGAKDERKLLNGVDGIRVAVYTCPVPAINPYKLETVERHTFSCLDCGQNYIGCTARNYFLSRQETMHRMQCPYCNNFNSSVLFNLDIMNGEKYSEPLFEAGKEYTFIQLYPMRPNQLLVLASENMARPQEETEKDKVEKLSRIERAYEQINMLKDALSNCEELIVENADAFQSPEEVEHYQNRFERVLRISSRVLEVLHDEFDELDTEMDKVLIQQELNARGIDKHF